LKKRIAFFDFDGTITTKDTLLEFIKYCSGPYLFYAGFLLNSPWLLAYKMKIISNQLAKERILTFFFGKMKVETFQQKCDRFSYEVLPGLLRIKAVLEIERLKELDATIVVVSASPENWIRDWVQRMQLELIATKLDVRNGRLSGRIEGKNCYGKEKLRRIKEKYDLSLFDETYAYGDSRGDTEMLRAVKISAFQPFL
jgi:phosphatidylglycerophosphatase C